MSDFDLASAKPVEFDLASAKAAHRFGTGQSLDVIGAGQTAPTSSPEAVVARSPVAGNNFLQNALIGSGKYFTDLGLGARQLYGQTADAMAGGNRTAGLLAEAAQKRQTDAPVMSTTGGKVGQIGTGVLSTLPLSAIPGAGTYLGATAIGAGLGALQPVTGGESRVLNTAVGGALGAGGKYVGDRVGNYLASRQFSPLPPGPSLTPAQEQAANAGGALGMRLTPGQQSGSRSLQQLEAKLESQPWTSGPVNAIKEGNQQALGAAAARSIGETGHSVDASVLDAANMRLGNVFDSVRNPRSVVAINPPTSSAVIDQIDNDVAGLIPGSIRDNALVRQFTALADSGGANGQQLGTLSSKLGRAAYKQMSGPNGDRDLGHALYAVKDHVDDLLESSLTGTERTAYAAARQQYRSLMQLTSRTNIVNPSSGTVNGVALANKLQQSDRPGFLFGRNQSDLYNAARFAQAFKPVVGDSGTATRSLGLADLTAAPLGIPANLASRLYFSRAGRAVAPPLARFMSIAPTLARNALPAAARGTGQLLQRLPPGTPALLTPYLTQQ